MNTVAELDNMTIYQLPLPVLNKNSSSGTDSCLTKPEDVCAPFTVQSSTAGPIPLPPPPPIHPDEGVKPLRSTREETEKQQERGRLSLLPSIVPSEGTIGVLLWPRA
jgi:hypothetical protein